MKLQDLNRSFGKVLGALAVALMIQTGSAQAQQGQWAEDGCFYTAVFHAAPSGALQGSMQMVRQGCAVQSPDGQARYYDLGTGQLYLMENNPSQQGSKVGKIFKSLIASHKQVIQALQARRADPAPMDPQAMQQGANSVPVIPQAMQQAAYSAAQQGTNPYFAVPYAVVGGAPVGGGPVTSGPNAPAGNLGLPSNGPDPAIKPQNKQTRTKAIKARTTPSCAASDAGCQ